MQPSEQDWLTCVISECRTKLLNTALAMQIAGMVFDSNSAELAGTALLASEMLCVRLHQVSQAHNEVGASTPPIL